MGCERQMGIDRGDLAEIDGFYAVILWNEYRRTGDERKLKLLLITTTPTRETRKR